jgi:hypothetical protein
MKYYEKSIRKDLKTTEGNEKKRERNRFQWHPLHEL